MSEPIAKIEDYRGNWQAELILSEKKLPKPLLANAITAFRHSPEWAGLLAFDAFHARTMLRGTARSMENEIDEPWTSAHDVLAADWLQHQGICVSPDIAGQAVEAVAGETRFHPVLDYLGRCKWDGENRLENWGIKHLGAADNGYTRAVSAKWMIGAVARVSEPGCKNDCAIILEGAQGLGKSTALKALSQPWFTDEIADLGTKTLPCNSPVYGYLNSPSSTAWPAAMSQRSRDLCRAPPIGSGRLTRAASSSNRGSVFLLAP